MSDLFPIHGDGFLLRQPQAADARPLADIEFDVKVKRYLNIPSKTKDEWIEAFDPQTFTAICVEVQGNVAGRASISRYRPGLKGYAELAIVIGCPWWGHGLGAKIAHSLVELAFIRCNAKGIVGIVHPKHQASIGLLMSLGFRKRGTVINPSEEWQRGHLIYRLPNRSFEATASGKPASAPQLKR